MESDHNEDRNIKTGILGGTFDPVHSGHIFLAMEAKKRFGLDKVLLMPTDDPYYKAKDNVTSFEDRLNMVRLAVKDHPGLIASDFERVHDTDGYTINTLKAFKKEFPDDDIYFIIGGDSLFTMENWKDAAEIFKMAVILVNKRKDESKGASGTINVTEKDKISDHADNDISLDDELDLQIRYLKDRFGADIRNINAEQFDVSSSELRCKIKNGEDIEGLVPDKVEQYIKENDLYKIRT